MKNIYLILALGLPAIFAGCSKDSTTEPVIVPPTAAEYLTQGWANFNAGNYAAAQVNFDNAIGLDTSLADARNGKGWCQGILGSPAGALAAFKTGLVFSDANHEIRAGMAFSYSAMDSAEQACSSALMVLGADSLWLFSHTYRESPSDNQLNYKEVRLLLCQNYFKRAVFDSSLIWVKMLNPVYSNDSLTVPSGQTALQPEIERLAGKM